MITDLIQNKLRRRRFKKNWRIKNRSNFTNAVPFFDQERVSVGKYTYGDVRALTFDSCSELRIGSFCSIGPNVEFVVSADHFLNHLSSYPFKNKIIDGSLEGVSKGNIVVDDDVWIGYGSVILSGVHIGQGAVIAAGSIVTKDVIPYAIVGGTPAKVIKKRFEQEVIDYLLTFDYNQLDEEMVWAHRADLYTQIDDKTLDEIKEIYEWFPKKKC